MRINWWSFTLGALTSMIGWGVLKIAYLFGRYSHDQDIKDEFIRQEAANVDDELRNMEE